MNSNSDYLNSFGITLYEFIPERFRSSLVNSTPPPKFDENGFRRILSSYIRKFRNKFTKFTIVNDITLLKDDAYYLLSELDSEYPTIGDKSDDSNRIILMNSDKQLYSLTFKNSLELGQNTLVPLEDREEDVGETEEDREEDAGETDEDREEDAGVTDEDREEDAGETDEDSIEIKLHPNDSKYYDSLPIIKLRTEKDDITNEYRVGYSNIVYSEKDKPYGMILTPIIQGRKIEIFKFE